MTWTLKKGAEEGRLRLIFLDEVGFSLSLPLSHGWSKVAKTFRVPKHWGSAGRINIIGSLGFFQTNKTLSYRLIEGRCQAIKVLPYLQTLVEQARQLAVLTVIVLDNAGFHRAKIIQQERDAWEKDLVFLRFLPPYSPQLNPIEIVWKHVKHFLLPRRCYPSRADLLQAVLFVFELIGATSI